MTALSLTACAPGVDQASELAQKYLTALSAGDVAAAGKLAPGPSGADALKKATKRIESVKVGKDVDPSFKGTDGGAQHVEVPASYTLGGKPQTVTLVAERKGDTWHLKSPSFRGANFSEGDASMFELGGVSADKEFYPGVYPVTSSSSFVSPNPPTATVTFSDSPDLGYVIDRTKNTDALDKLDAALKSALQAAGQQCAGNPKLNDCVGGVLSYSTLTGDGGIQAMWSAFTVDEFTGTQLSLDSGERISGTMKASSKPVTVVTARWADMVTGGDRCSVNVLEYSAEASASVNAAGAVTAQTTKATAKRTGGEMNAACPN